VAREAWIVDWKALRTPLGLPGQRQGICTRTSFVALSEGLAPKKAECHFYATDLDPRRFDEQALRALIREHWGIENHLHHPKDRTWLEDRHWVGNKKTGAMVTMLRAFDTPLPTKTIPPFYRLSGRRRLWNCPGYSPSGVGKSLTDAGADRRMRIPSG
jgi:hypothetical protein